MLNLVGAMLAILVTWGVIGVLLVGVGLLVTRRRNVSRDCFAWRVAISPFVGLAGVVAVAQVWHFFAAITLLTWIVVTLLSAVGWWRFGWGNAVGVFRSALKNKPSAVASMMILLWLANRAVGPGDAHDSGLYHYAAIDWTNAFPLQKGLANLQLRLGFNNAATLWHAMLNGGPWRGRGEHLGNSSLLAMTVGMIAVGWAGVLRRHRRPRAVEVYGLLIMVPLALVATSKDINSGATDLSAAFVTLTLGAAVLRLSRARRLRPSDAAVVGLLGGLAIACKISTLFFVLPAVAYLLLRPLMSLCLKHQTTKLTSPAKLTLLTKRKTSTKSATSETTETVETSEKPAKDAEPPTSSTGLPSGHPQQDFTQQPQRHRRVEGRPFLCIGIALTLFLTIVGPWVLRGVYLSGYALFPSDVLSADVPWQSPPAVLRDERKNIDESAKLLNATFAYSVLNKTPLRGLTVDLSNAVDRELLLDGWGWLGPWFWGTLVMRVMHFHLPWLLCAGASLAVFAYGRPMVIGRLLSLLGVVALATVGWFATAPEPRFAYGVFWFAAGAGLGLAAEGGLLGRSRRLYPTVAVLLAVTCVGYQAASDAVGRGNRPFARIPFFPPGEDHGLHPLPVPTLTKFVTRGGVTLYAPVDGSLVWRGPLGATVLPNPFLRRNADGTFLIDPELANEPPTISETAWADQHR